MSFVPINRTIETQDLLNRELNCPSSSASPVPPPPSQWPETLPPNYMAETEYSEGEEAALAREPVGKPIPGVTISQEELAEVLKMVDEEASREAEQQRQSQITTEDEAEVVRPPEK
ncbi:hypothetical protein LTS18_002555, partial [Coniosporium uncinatum]